MKNYNVYKLIIVTKKLVVLSFVTCYLFSVIGCEAFIRKFTRKKKKDLDRGKIVFAPEEYQLPELSIQEQYRQYFVFWRSWQEELIETFNSSLDYTSSRECLEEVIKNLAGLRALLPEIKQKDLDRYLEKIRHLQKQINDDPYGSNVVIYKSKAQSLKRAIEREFAVSKVGDTLVGN